MKIFVLGDTHGRNKEFLESIMYYERPDMLFHLGDYVEDGEKAIKDNRSSSLIVRGNGDFGSKYQEDEIIELRIKDIFNPWS